MTRQTDKCAAISGAVAGFALLAIVAVTCELTLLDKMYDCQRDRIDKWTRAVLVSETNQTATFVLPNGANCSVFYAGGLDLCPNATVDIYKSDSGSCASKIQDYFCGENVVLFNILFFLCGGALFTCFCGMVVVHDLLMICWAKVERAQANPPLPTGPRPTASMTAPRTAPMMEEPTVELVELSTSSSSKQTMEQ